MYMLFDKYSLWGIFMLMMFNFEYIDNERQKFVVMLDTHAYLLTIPILSQFLILLLLLSFGYFQDRNIIKLLCVTSLLGPFIVPKAAVTQLTTLTRTCVPLQFMHLLDSILQMMLLDHQVSNPISILLLLYDFPINYNILCMPISMSWMDVSMSVCVWFDDFSSVEITVNEIFFEYLQKVISCHAYMHMLLNPLIKC